MSTPPPTADPRQQELKDATEHIHYEIRMLFDAFTKYWVHEPTPYTADWSNREKFPEWIHKCVLEATLIHARSLDDFFTKSQRQTGRKKLCKKCKAELDEDEPEEQTINHDDVFASDFGFTAQKLLEAGLRKRINKSIAHICASRSGIYADKANWEFTKWIPPVLHRSANFFQHLINIHQQLSDSLKPDEFKKFISQLKAAK